MKKKISSDFTFVYKFIFPLMWLVFTVSFLDFENNLLKSFLVWFVASLFTIPFWWLCIALKEVYIQDDFLVIQNFIKRSEIKISEIDEITENVNLNVHPIWIKFKKSTIFGQKIMFTPKIKIIGKKTHPIVSELNELMKIS